VAASEEVAEQEKEPAVPAAASNKAVGKIPKKAKGDVEKFRGQHVSSSSSGAPVAMSRATRAR